LALWPPSKRKKKLGRERQERIKKKTRTVYPGRSRRTGAASMTSKTTREYREEARMGISRGKKKDGGRRHLKPMGKENTWGA